VSIDILLHCTNWLIVDTGTNKKELLYTAALEIATVVVVAWLAATTTTRKDSNDRD
jgi:hypothetical protein